MKDFLETLVFVLVFSTILGLLFGAGYQMSYFLNSDPSFNILKLLIALILVIIILIIVFVNGKEKAP